MGDESETSDAGLIDAIHRRDQSALAEVFRRHGGAVWGLARRVTADDQLAEDVCQAVFLQLWTESERFDPSRGSLRAWLLAQAHGRAVDLVRSEAARRRRQLDGADRLRTQPAAEVEGAVQAALVAADVRHAVLALPEQERAPILLAYFAGYTYRQAAARLGQPEGTVKSRIRSGLARLRTVLDTAGVTP